MAFGQQAGPPASYQQVQQLLTLLHEHGHRDFRDARGPLGFTQRQAAGKFTRDEAAAFIERLQEADLDGPGPTRPAPAATAMAPELSASEQLLRRLPAEPLAAELQRRGWIVVAP